MTTLSPSDVDEIEARAKAANPTPDSGHAQTCRCDWCLRLWRVGSSIHFAQRDSAADVPLLVLALREAWAERDAVRAELAGPTWRIEGDWYVADMPNGWRLCVAEEYEGRWFWAAHPSPTHMSQDAAHTSSLERAKAKALAAALEAK